MTDNFRINKPAEKKAIHFKQTAPEIITLGNSIKVMHIYRDKLPIIQTFAICSGGGAKYDNPAKNGIASLTAMLLDEGAGSLDAIEIDDRFESMGTVFEISCDYDFVLLSMLSTKEFFFESMDLLSDIIIHPQLNEEDFIREKDKLQTRILELNDDPAYLSDKYFQKVVFKNSCYELPISGENKTVENILYQDIKEFYNNSYSPESLSFLIVGDIGKDDLINKIEQLFGKWGKNIVTKEPLNLPVNPDKGIYLFPKTNSVQTEVKIGLLTPPRRSPDFFEKLIINTILGGQFSSRLNSNLREKNGFTYGVHSSFNYLKDAATFSIATSVKKENTFDAIEQIFFELTRFANDITEEEINFAKTYLIRRLPIAFETYAQTARNYFNILQHNLDINYYNSYIENINRCSIDSIIEIYKKVILPEKISTLLVGELDPEESTKFNIEIID